MSEHSDYFDTPLYEEDGWNIRMTSEAGNIHAL